MNRIYDTASLQQIMLASLPMARAMKVQVGDYDGNRLLLVAPLAPNVNDKGCAFGGSLGSVLTLAGWGLINLRLAEVNLHAEVFIKDCQLSFISPVWDKITAEAFALDNPWEAFFQELQDKGKARISIESEITGEMGGLVAARQTSRFVAMLAQQ